ncbi:hypothetical protein LAV84_22470 [Rhizobium sp. VS19-DR104.2]|uniref:hypothetical protein n=1 Tax=unclassified Rhizobium TaxID=2613769 RepID=UPI001CC62BEE|nr:MULTISPECIES: hypothetical protein [unclassified Rhizobium]MBZ5761997.1 hypothetical protein [Rhizobium sp. VS19-DR96]MBZ5768357.1 hypothetical protein [Rhizobium sp. VS19-DR129.2]MBZ5775627.1 hypothetical protein [Rhizobium sp. VS19-DRK62.2]MBZ5786875.1 hypothetical protein [Rhizobium sp. VS19-DR121]MBZ5804445.1 hypothetical protein [Rhizobium sp. VS19-DR181]
MQNFSFGFSIITHLCQVFERSRLSSLCPRQVQVVRIVVLATMNEKKRRGSGRKVEAPIAQEKLNLRSSANAYNFGETFIDLR